MRRVLKFCQGISKKHVLRHATFPVNFDIINSLPCGAYGLGEGDVYGLAGETGRKETTGDT